MHSKALLSSTQWKVMILSALGGVLEFFDFIIYIFLVPYLQKIFFASTSSYVTTLKTLAVFSAGYLVRPIGGIVFSHFGDRYGRKVVFLLTVLFMTLPAFAIGVLPSTAQIGIMAPILLLLFRLMQGLALGGEIPAAITFISEHITQSRHGMAMSILFFGINMGLMLGSFATFLLTQNFSEQQILDYAWRIPFLIGGVFGLAAIILRRHLEETKAFKALSSEQKAAIPFVELIKIHPAKVIQGIILVASGALCIFMYLYWPQYLHQYLDYDYNQVMTLNTIGTCLLSLTILMWGKVSDTIGYNKTYLIGLIALLLVTYPLYGLFATGKLSMAYLSYFVFTIIFGMFPCCYGTLLPTLFPTSIRYSGIALSYNLSFAFFSGLSPLICTVLIYHFDSIYAPAWYMMGTISLTALLCWSRLKKPKLVFVS